MRRTRHLERMLTSDAAPLTIRPALADDDPGLRRLAALDSSTVPGAPVMIVEQGGEIRAAVSARDLSVIADPFHPTAQLVELVKDYLHKSDAVTTRPPYRGALGVVLHPLRLLTA